MTLIDSDPPPVDEAAASGRFAYDGLDRVFHEKARLGILTSLVAHPRGLVFADLPGDGSVVGNAEIVHTWVHSFSRTIAAGTSQIQRNIIAERILGLPKG